MKTHELKILPEYFEAVRSGKKKFELRKNDRNFHVGDVLYLREWDGNEYTGKYEYTGESVNAVVTYILYEWMGLDPGWCVMSIDLVAGE